MSLGDMQRRVNAAGHQASNLAASRILAEKEAHDKQVHMREVDRIKHEISHRRLEHQKIVGETERVKRDLIRLKTGPRDNRTLDLIRSTESQIRTLESEARTIDQDIRMKTLEVQRHGGLSF